MKPLNLDQLRSFLLVSETGNFSEAGRRLNLTQPAVSQQIKELEAALSVRLLDRLGKKAYPTAAGAELREHAQRLLQQAELAVEAMRAHRDGGWSRVRVATSATLGAYVLPPLLLRLRKTHPRLEVSVVAGPTREMLRRVVDNEADIAFVNGPAVSTHEALDVVVASESAMLAFWPRSFGAPPDAVRAEHLADKTFIFYTPGNLNHDIVHAWFDRSGSRPAAEMEFDSGLSIVALVDAGLGVSILPNEVVMAAAVSERVATRPLDPPIPTQLYVAIHKDKPRHEALRLVHSALLEVRIAA